MPALAQGDVIGRDEELAELDEVLSALHAGPAGIVLVGDAGVGKTTLWRAGIEAARVLGYHVLETRPAEAEARLAFAGLGDLLDAELPDILDTVPPPQADALRVALLLDRPTGPPPDERAVAVAVLTALRTRASDAPVLVAVDDLQWLDPASGLVLAFAWRRLRDEPVGLLLAKRTGERAAADLVDERVRRLDVPALSLGAVHRLLRDQTGLVLPPPGATPGSMRWPRATRSTR